MVQWLQNRHLQIEHCFFQFQSEEKLNHFTKNETILSILFLLKLFFSSLACFSKRTKYFGIQLFLGPKLLGPKASIKTTK